MVRLTLFICINFISVNSFGITPEQRVQCRSSLGDLSIAQNLVLKPNDNGYMQAYDARTTDFFVNARVYKLEFILENLGIDKATSEDLFTGKKVYLIAEGYSPLLPFLLFNGADVIAADIWYHLAIPESLNQQAMQKFVESYRHRLQLASALHIPQMDNSQDFVFSHMLLNNFLNKDMKVRHEYISRVLEEAIRILKPGGKAIFASLADEEELRPSYLHVLRHFPGIQIKSSTRNVTVTPEEIHEEGNLGVPEAAQQAHELPINTLVIIKN
ncbi:MAG: methyltransferase domain-containing protein [Bdellovibrionales bacterium]|nr:methyltransferase domain-containing protein [Bdellovibrionales bacterium]